MTLMNGQHPVPLHWFRVKGEGMMMLPDWHNIYQGSPFAKTSLFKGGIQRLLRPLGSMPNGRNDVSEGEAPDFRPGRMSTNSA